MFYGLTNGQINYSFFNQKYILKYLFSLSIFLFSFSCILISLSDLAREPLECFSIRTLSLSPSSSHLWRDHENKATLRYKDQQIMQLAETEHLACLKTCLRVFSL